MTLLRPVHGDLDRGHRGCERAVRLDLPGAFALVPHPPGDSRGLFGPSDADGPATGF